MMTSNAIIKQSGHWDECKKHRDDAWQHEIQLTKAIPNVRLTTCDTFYTYVPSYVSFPTREMDKTVFISSTAETGGKKHHIWPIAQMRHGEYIKDVSLYGSVQREVYLM